MIVYTFRTFPEIEELQKLFGEVVVLSSLKKDMEAFMRRIELEHPDLVLGVAATKGESRVEPIAVNRFNNGVVSRGGVETLDLQVPKILGLKTAEKPTHTFCNWTMYKLQEFVVQNNLRTKVSFCHLKSSETARIEPLSGLVGII